MEGAEPLLYRFKRAARPPLRPFGTDCRDGNSSMIDNLVSRVILDQRDISSIERLHPVQSRVSGCTTQI